MNLRSLLPAALAIAMLCTVLPATSVGQVSQGRTVPKNIIVMISDGCGYNHIQAANAWHDGAFESQPYEQFPQKFFLSTYPAKAEEASDKGSGQPGYNSHSAWATFTWVKHGATGSAAAATALATGQETAKKRVGVDVNLKPLQNITECAILLGKSAGVVTSVPWTHATPASFVAHNRHRENYEELAREMLLDSRLSVIMGAGHPLFDDNARARTDAYYRYVGGEDAWKHLMDGSTTFGVAANSGNSSVQDIDGDGMADAWTLIESEEDFHKLTHGDTPLRVLGLPRVHETLQQKRGTSDGKEDAYVVPFNEGIPTLEVMTRGALNVLDNNTNGFFLMVEGGAVDWAAHDNQPGRLIEEEHDFNNAVKAVITWIEANGGWEENLLIVTADHETGYLTGPKEADNSPVTNPIINNGKHRMPGMRFNSDGHTNQLIPFYARGTGSELFSRFADERDLVRGRYLHNAEVGQVMLQLWRGNGVSTGK
ncbi:alkaline phosphatase [bacterium]|nr:alkaline phosphatase [bacterium]